MEFLCTTLAAIFCVALAHGEPTRGSALYQKRCSACHSPDFNGLGPAHRGVFGREAGQAKGFLYSDALKASRLIWDESTLDLWLTDPEKLVPGQRMGVNVPSGEERANLIAYLKQLKATK
jgi:cytochrome c